MIVKIDGLPPDRQLNLIGLVDDQGVDLGQPPGGSSEDDQCLTYPKVGLGVQSVRVKVALSEFRYFEFLARPTRE